MSSDAEATDIAIVLTLWCALHLEGRFPNMELVIKLFANGFLDLAKGFYEGKDWFTVAISSIAGTI